MTIAQLNATYIEGEDRILFRLTTQQGEEFPLWLTRRVTQQLLWTLHQTTVNSLSAAHSPQVAETIASFRQENLEKQSQFTTFVPGNKHPLGNSPILVIGCSTSPHASTGQQFHLTLVDKRVLNLPMQEAQIGQWVLLLDKIQRHAGWALETRPVHANPTTDTTSAKPEPSSGQKGGGRVLH